jgi:hypothetical protein
MISETTVLATPTPDSFERLEAEFLRGSDPSAWLSDSEAPRLDLQSVASHDEPMQYLTSRRSRPHGYCCR